MGNIRIWLDDERKMPEGYTHHCKTAKEAIELIKTGQVEKISLDHDLGEDNGNGYDVAKFIEEHAITGQLKEFHISVHSMNPVGKQNIKTAIRNAIAAWIDGSNK